MKSRSFLNLLVLICMVHLTVCSCHVTYAFQNESTLYSCQSVRLSKWMVAKLCQTYVKPVRATDLRSVALCLFFSLQVLHYLVTITVLESEKPIVQFHIQALHILDDVTGIWCLHCYHSWYSFDFICNNDNDNQVVWHIFHLFIFLIDFIMSSHDHYTRSSKKFH